MERRSIYSLSSCILARFGEQAAHGASLVENEKGILADDAIRVASKCDSCCRIHTISFCSGQVHLMRGDHLDDEGHAGLASGVESDVQQQKFFLDFQWLLFLNQGKPLT